MERSTPIARRSKETDINLNSDNVRRGALSFVLRVKVELQWSREGAASNI